MQLAELSSRGAVASGQREPARQFVIDSRPDRHPTGPAAPHVALYSPQAGAARMLVPRRASKGCCRMHERQSRPLTLFPRLNDRCPLDLDSKKDTRKYCPPDHPPWLVLVASTANGAWSKVIWTHSMYRMPVRHVLCTPRLAALALLPSQSAATRRYNVCT